jgi:hypothetical protein
MLEVKGVSEKTNQEGENSNQDIVQLSKQELSQEELVDLVKKAMNNGEHESMFILTLSEWRRPGDSFKDYGRFRILYGDAEIFELNSVYDYPTTDETLYGIIPKTKAVVIVFEWGNDYQGKFQKYAKLYIFSFHRGWKSIDLY